MSFPRSPKGGQGHYTGDVEHFVASSAIALTSLNCELLFLSLDGKLLAVRDCSVFHSKVVTPVQSALPQHVVTVMQITYTSCKHEYDVYRIWKSHCFIGNLFQHFAVLFHETAADETNTMTSKPQKTTVLTQHSFTSLCTIPIHPLADTAQILSAYQLLPGNLQTVPELVSHCPPLSNGACVWSTGVIVRCVYKARNVKALMP